MNAKYYKLLIITVFLISGCVFSYKEGDDSVITDLNGYFNGYITINDSNGAFISEIPVEAAIVQTQTSLYGTMSGVFNTVFEEVRITGHVNDLTVVIEIEGGIGPVTFTGTVEERSMILYATKTDNDQILNLTLFLETDRILPLRHEIFI